MQTLIVKINKTDASLSVDRQLVLGSHYQVQFVGLGEGEIGTLILSSCRKGKTIAATNEDGVLAINTQEAIDVFERKPNCPYAITIHAYVTVESATIAESTLSLLWSPMQFDINGSPVQFVGPAGPKGETGPSLYDTWLDMNPEGTWEEFVNEFRGKDGKDGLTLTRDGLYAFTVEGENLYISANNESVLFGNDEFGNIDRTKPKWKIINGYLHYIFYKDGKEYTKVNLGSVLGPVGPQGAKGDAGITEAEKQAISSAIASIPDLRNGLNVLDRYIGNVSASLDSHTSAQNPHRINAGMIGAVDEGTFNSTINATREEFAQRIASGDENVLEQVKGLISKVLTYKGSVPTYDDLPYENIEAGDVYNVEDTGMNYAWNDSQWDALGGIIEITADMVKINLPSYNKLSDWLSAVDYFMGQLPSSDSIKKAMSDSNNHIRNTSNPHEVKVEQLTDKSAGTLVIVFDDELQNLSGEFRFEFDPYMFNRGNLSFTLNVGEYAPPPIANRTINYNGKVHIIENWEGNNQWPVFVTEGRVGDSVYFYVQVIDLKEDATSSARLFFLIGGDGDATSPSQITPFGDCVPSTISEFVYQQGGIFQVMTEKILRDKETHKAYTIVVENGELKLQEYRISEYEV